MTERERLIELLWECLCGGDKQWAGEIADYLLANGVIVPPFKVGDDIWYIDENKVKCEKGDIYKIVYSGNGKFEIMDRHGGIDEVGTTYAYLSQKEAEKALKGDVE